MKPQDPRDIRLFLEDICCELCRFREIARDGVEAEQVRIDREVCLGPTAFADIRVRVGAELPYYVEVKYGYPLEVACRHVARKYGGGGVQASKLIVVVDTDQVEKAEAQLGAAVPLPVEVWNVDKLLGEVDRRFGIHINSITASNLVDVRNEVDRAKGFLAFGGESLATYRNGELQAYLLWHFGFWRLRELRAQGLQAADVLAPGKYEKVVVLLADLCSFSSFVRDTSDYAVVRHSLTSFYTKARYQVINRGGMLVQFVGDEVVAFFGLPDRREDYQQDALQTARALLDIGNAIAEEWQRSIDRVQTSGGVHVGMAIGEIEVFPQRPFSHTHMGQVGDAINLAARLMATAGPGEIVMSNLLYREIEDTPFGPFLEQEPLEAKNVGRVKAWKYSLPAADSERSALRS